MAARGIDGGACKAARSGLSLFNTARTMYKTQGDSRKGALKILAKDLVRKSQIALSSLDESLISAVPLD